MEPSLLTFKNVIKHYPILGGVFKRKVGNVSVLNGIDLEVKKGEITGLVGESGCGKSTLAKLVLKLEDATSGELVFDDQPVNRIKGSEKKNYYRRVQMVFQDPYSSLNPRMRVKEIIGEMIRIQGEGKEAVFEKTVKMLKEVGLPESAMERYPHEFSGGQRQRIAIARALVVEPDLLIADEPVSALDLALQVKTLELLKNLKESFNLTILLISHDLRKVAGFCQTVAVMYLGRIVEIIPANLLLTSCKHPYTQALIASIPATHPIQRKKGRTTIKGEVPSPINLPPGCAFHARCPHRMPQCNQEIPILKQVENNHQVACFLL